MGRTIGVLRYTRFEPGSHRAGYPMPATTAPKTCYLPDSAFTEAHRPAEAGSVARRRSGDTVTYWYYTTYRISCPFFNSSVGRNRTRPVEIPRVG